MHSWMEETKCINKLRAIAQEWEKRRVPHLGLPTIKKFIASLLTLEVRLLYKVHLLLKNIPDFGFILSIHIPNPTNQKSKQNSLVVWKMVDTVVSAVAGGKRIVSWRIQAHLLHDFANSLKGFHRRIRKGRKTCYSLPTQQRS